MIGIILTLISTIALAQEPVKIMIVDSGVESSHPYLKNFLTEEINLISNEKMRDETGHGTHVTGLIKSYLEKPVSVILVKVQSSNPKKDIQVVDSDREQKQLKGLSLDKIIDIAIDKKVKIINISMVTGTHLSKNLEAIIKAKNHGIFLVVGAGNSNVTLKPYPSEDSLYPCGYKHDNVICVGAYLEIDGSIDAGFTNRGKEYVDVFSTSSILYSSDLKGTFEFRNGTSMATPLITASLAGFLYQNKEKDLKKIRESYFKTLKYSEKLKEFSSTGLYLPFNGKVIPEKLSVFLND